MPFDFTGRKILVTGSGRGIGRGIAKAIAEAGGDVYALSRSREPLDSLVKESERIHPIVVDLGDWDTTRAAVDKLEALDGVVNNGAEVLGEFRSALDCPKEVFERSLNVNILGVINVIQSATRKMIEAGKGGSIVNVSSILSLNPCKGAINFNVSKAGLDMVTKQFALELGPHKIRVNSVNPTRVSVESMPKCFEDEPERGKTLLSLTPMGRFCDLKECVDPILYLLSEHSTMVTGTMHVTDGGLLSNIPI